MMAERKAVRNRWTIGVSLTHATHALWADRRVFALVWKHGGIGFKLPEESV
jgi:hypothetical protein